MYMHAVIRYMHEAIYITTIVHIIIEMHNYLLVIIHFTEHVFY